MIIRNLHIKNIGPFKDIHLEFASTYNSKTNEQPITIITGENGAGKSIIIDAIRAALSGQAIERNIVANEQDFVIEMDIERNGHTGHLITNKTENGNIKYCDYEIQHCLRFGYKDNENVNDWIIDYWSSKSATGNLKISTLENINHHEVLKNVIYGQKNNVDLVNFICNVDYLRTSEMEKEKILGNVIFEKLKEIINTCLDNGKFKYVRRTDLTPIVEQNAKELSLEQLSSGNISLIENLLSLTCKMYSVCVMLGKSADEIFNTPGLLLIDEIETHLHPKWQKSILNIIRYFFPNLQIILTTHSPFIVSAIAGVKIYTCVPKDGYSELFDETGKYDNKPIDEILMSKVFEIYPFNENITELIKKREQLIKEGDMEGARKIANRLYNLNCEYFSFLNPEG